MTEISGATYGCRDPKDEMLIETAIRGRASAIVTHDKDLLDDDNLIRLLATRGIRVLRAGEFLREIESQEPGAGQIIQ
jgi:predicted nucleic acid-binding protein